MYLPIIKKFNLKIIISYTGILPFIVLFIDYYVLNLNSLIFLKNFIIYYLLLIYTFIGAMRWSFSKENDLSFIVYGFLPSLISTILIFYNLLSDNKNLILILISFFLILQLIGDFIFYLKNKNEKYFFLYIRLPVTFIILFNIFYLISV